MGAKNSLVECFGDLPDPRMVNKCRHKLLDIVMIAICATIADADSWDDIAAFAEGKEAWLRRWLALPNGVPSADTIKRVFEHLDADAFLQRFTAWVQAVFVLTQGQVVAIDGKTLRGTCDATGQSSLHVVSAWATANALVLAQVNVDDKSNEIPAIPELLDLLTVKGCIITLDALGCQKKIVDKIREKEADYVVTVKGNQPKLQQAVQAAFAQAAASGLPTTSPGYCSTHERGHGRTETRQCWVLPNVELQTAGWRDCQTLVRIDRTRQVGTGKTSHETHYYLTSLPPLASLVLGAVRAHWGIENSCHWVLDVVFGEDASRTRTKNADDNLTVLRKIALNLVRQHPAKGTLKGKRYRAALNEDFLLQVMLSSSNLMR
ncbi:MAG: ISAs1 family transposase [Caldilineaceae bacterium]